MQANVIYKVMTIENVTMSAVMHYSVSFDIPNERMTTELAQQLTELGAQITFYTKDVHVIVDKKECEIIYNPL